MTIPVYTYFMPLGGQWPLEDNLRLIDVWKRSWAKQGWAPQVLTEADVAARSPHYAEFKAKYWALPTEYGHDYEGSCFMRWLAMAAVGGGFLTDYDVINYSFPPRAVDPEKMLVFSGGRQMDLFMGMVSASQKRWADMSRIFADWVPDQGDFNWTSQTYRGFHCSDLSWLRRVFADGTLAKPDWLHRESEGCQLYTMAGWEIAPVVHYGYHMHHNGFWPKWKWIEQLRPF